MPGRKSANNKDRVLSLVEVAQLAAAGCPLTTEQAATFLQGSKATLEVWRSLGKGPRFVLYGTSPRYRKDDLDNWLAANTHRKPGSPNAGRPPKNRRRP